MECAWLLHWSNVYKKADVICYAAVKTVNFWSSERFCSQHEQLFLIDHVRPITRDLEIIAEVSSSECNYLWPHKGQVGHVGFLSQIDASTFMGLAGKSS